MRKLTKRIAILLILLLSLTACSKIKTGVYLGQDLFLEKDQIIKIHAPEGTILKLGKTYEYSYDEIMTYLPPQATAKEIKEVDDKDVKISEELAKELVTYANAKIVTKDTDLSDLSKDTILITDNKEDLRQQGFNVVLEKR